MEGGLVENPLVLLGSIQIRVGGKNGRPFWMKGGGWKLRGPGHQEVALVGPWMMDVVLNAEPMHQ